ncbi:MAG: HAMP domain-containing histidine kinase [Lachnospiraceae bacterium]|nr:HAMP domain-containing histidine kinase [Lachnospiraceae bacterium]
MKNFFRSIPGKVVLFITFILSCFALVVCIFGASVFFECGFYENGEEELFGREVSHEIVGEWVDLLNYGLFDEKDEVREYKYDGNLILHVYDENGDLTGKTEAPDNTPTEDIELEYDVVLYLNPHFSSSIWEYSSIRSPYYHYETGMINEDKDDKDDTFQNLKIKAAFKKGFPESDRYALIYKGIHMGYRFRYAVFVIGIIAAIMTLPCFIILMCVSAKRKEDEELHPGPLHKVPFDLIAAAANCIVVLYIASVCNYADQSMGGVIAAFVTLPFVLAVILGFCMSCAARIKDRSIFTNTVIWQVLKILGKCMIACGKGLVRFGRFIFELIKSLPIAWKALLLIGIDSLVNLLIFMLVHEHSSFEGLVILVFKTALLAGFGVFVCMKLKILKDGAAQLANGNITGQIDTKGLLPEMKKHAENLNSIGRGMNTAVEQRLKSERMKAELITNVSHDIKTPLTSIINYTGLIANESCDNNKHSQYGEVLMRQAERLKRLLEDLVEASKASTGNLDVNLAPCDAAVFVSQASGEYQEKLEAAQLSLVVKQPEENLRIMADGRRMWRIFDNLMNNICKYSLPGTRVYLTLDRFGDTARFLFKNTSRDVLDISEDELMERFVRGDASRNTEGNGLGLSIAKSMAQLQNGVLKIETDGDLFKAILMFPLIAE